MDNIITVALKQSYGRDLLYPDCEDSVTICQLLNTKTLSNFHIRKLRELGYTFQSHSDMRLFKDDMLTTLYK